MVPATGAACGSTHVVSSTHAVIHVVRGGDTTSTAAGDHSNIPPIYSSLRVTLGGDITEVPVTGGSSTDVHAVPSVSTFISSSDHPTVVKNHLKDLDAAICHPSRLRVPNAAL